MDAWSVTALIAFSTIVGTPGRAFTVEPPWTNVVFLLTDDQLRESFGCYGSTQGLTPVVDRLAAEGARFSRASVTTPVCAPSRITGLTGRYSGGFMPYILNTGAHFPASQVTVATYLKSAGYRTAIIGKLHFHLEGVPAKESLEDQMHRLGFTESSRVHRTNFEIGAHLESQEKDFAVARDFIVQNKDRPFALFLFTTLTHGPIEAPQASINKVPPGPNRTGRAMYRWLDDLTGELLGTLDQHGLRERTAILYAGDNPPSRGGGAAGSRNKGTLYDGWIPLVISLPGVARKGLVVEEVVQNIDYLPTILEICGIDIPADTKLDGRSLVPLLKGEKASWREEAFFEIESGRAVRTDRWKYILFRPTTGMWRPLEKQLVDYGHKQELLFDLKSDPRESRNLADDSEYSEVLRDMRARLDKLCRENDYPFGEFGKE